MATTSCPSFTVIIPAAGSGRRMNADIPKQYIEILGKPLLYQTLRVFTALEECARIIIATDNRTRLQSLLDAEPVRKPVRIADGGRTRQESVAHALELVEDAELTLIHDAARPLVSAEDVRRVACAVQPGTAAVLGTPVRDTLKIVDGEFIESTPDRNPYWHAQTPQAAMAGLFKRGLSHAMLEGVVGTDDVSLLERLGVPVRMIAATGPNPKVTDPEDVPLIEFLLERRLGRHP